MRKMKFDYMDYLNIHTIKDDAVLLKDGSVCCILQVSPINTDKMSGEQRQEVFAHYRKWLNQLTYPVQIVSRTVNVDAKDQVGILKSIAEHEIKQKPEYKNTLKAFREFYDWLTQYVNNQCAGRRLYYIVISHTPTYAKPKETKEWKRYKESLEILKQRAGQAKLLEKTGVKVRRLTNTDLENLYSSYFTLFLELNRKYPARYLPSKRWIDMWKMEAVR